MLSDAGSTPAASTNLRYERSKDAKAATPKPLGKGGPNARSTTKLRLGRPAPDHEVLLRLHPSFINQPRPINTGFTENLAQRLHARNNGQCPHTAKLRLWQIKTAIALTDCDKALKFEQYLNSPSGQGLCQKALTISTSSSAERGCEDGNRKTICLRSG